jgi:hypothetical protein
LIQVAVAIFIITGFSAFVLDHGVLMVSRAQAQNAADAAALAGVITRVKDEPGDANPAVDGITEKVIQKAVDQHAIFGGTGTDSGRSWSWTCPTGVTGWCVRANVFRDGSLSSTTLPVYFATIWGQSSQMTKATATAVARSVNGTRCLKPWLIPDKWLEVQPPATQFNPPNDDYVPYNYVTNTPGTGYSLADIGTTVVLRPGNPAGAISPSDFYEIETATDYEENIAECRLAKKIGDVVQALPGFREGPTDQGLTTLLQNGPVDVVIGMFNPEEFALQDRQSGTFPLTIVNMLSVRITSQQNGRQISGTIIGGVGEDMGPGPTPTGAGALIYSISLVR